jgi:hypothetical protein
MNNPVTFPPGWPKLAASPLREQLQPLAHQIGVDAGEPSDVAPGVREARNDGRRHRIDRGYEYDWDRCCRVEAGPITRALASSTATSRSMAMMT